MLTPNEEELAAETIVRNQLKIKELEEENAKLKSFFRGHESAYPAGSSKEVGKFYIKVTANTRIDDGLAKKELSPSTYQAVAKLSIDTARARAFLDEETLDKITKKFDNKVEVGLI